MTLAEDSQKLAQAALRESSSMKTIAAMTLIFLPGTFICVSIRLCYFTRPTQIYNFLTTCTTKADSFLTTKSFFSMSFFNWHAGTGESITSSLWVYFAAAVPLTLLVILVWVFCTRRSRKKVGRWALKRRGTLLPRFEKNDRRKD